MSITISYWILDLEDEVHSIWVMDKRPLRMQGQFHFLKLGRAGMEHGLDLGSEEGVPEAGPS